MKAEPLTPLEKELLTEHFPTREGFAEALSRLNDGEPLAYVIGEWYFYGETYSLNPDCLIPRPDTEHLVDALLELVPKNGRFADLCTGSGCIAISTLVHRPDLRADAVDLSEGALEAAKKNAVSNGVNDRISVRRADVLRGEGLTGLYDVIVSNPPYIRTDVIPTLDTVRREPVRALDGGEDGLDFYRAILAKYEKHLAPGGRFVFEIGYDQADDLRLLCPGCEVRKDYGGNDRVVITKPKE